jgi:hypothetical protein
MVLKGMLKIIFFLSLYFKFNVILQKQIVNRHSSTRP